MTEQAGWDAGQAVKPSLSAQGLFIIDAKSKLKLRKSLTVWGPEADANLAGRLW